MKNRIVEADGMLTERRDTMILPFTEPLIHLFTRLDTWADEQRDALRAEIKTWVNGNWAIAAAECSKRPSARPQRVKTGGVPPGVR
jgi:hypothetical protein